MSLVEKKIVECRCPSCSVVLNGKFDGRLRKYKCDFGEEMFYELFCFACPRTNRPITMMETSFTETKFFWKTSDEDILDKYIKIEKIKNRKVKNVLVYLYQPIKNDMEEILDNLLENLKQYTDNGYKISLVVPEYLDHYVRESGIEIYIFKKWVIDDKFFSFCHGTKYGSPLAELNIVNEMRKWKEYKLVSIYPTVLPVFDIIDEENIDWERIEQLILI